MPWRGALQLGTLTGRGGDARRLSQGGRRTVPGEGAQPFTAAVKQHTAAALRTLLRAQRGCPHRRSCQRHAAGALLGEVIVLACLTATAVLCFCGRRTLVEQEQQLVGQQRADAAEREVLGQLAEFGGLLRQGAGGVVCGCAVGWSERCWGSWLSLAGCCGKVRSRERSAPFWQGREVRASAHPRANTACRPAVGGGLVRPTAWQVTSGGAGGGRRPASQRRWRRR